MPICLCSCTLQTECRLRRQAPPYPTTTSPSRSPLSRPSFALPSPTSMAMLERGFVETAAGDRSNRCGGAQELVKSFRFRERRLRRRGCTHGSETRRGRRATDARKTSTVATNGGTWSRLIVQRCRGRRGSDPGHAAEARGRVGRWGQRSWPASELRSAPPSTSSFYPSQPTLLSFDTLSFVLVVVHFLPQPKESTRYTFWCCCRDRLPPLRYLAVGRRSPPPLCPAPFTLLHRRR